LQATVLLRVIQIRIKATAQKQGPQGRPQGKQRLNTKNKTKLKIKTMNFCLLPVVLNLTLAFDAKQMLTE
jgi:hypothetical protein